MTISPGKPSRDPPCHSAGSRIRLFGYDRRGNITMIFGLVAATLAIAGLGGVDYANMLSARAAMQAAADAAATAAARELYLTSARDSQVRAVADSMARAKLASESSVASFSVDATVNAKRNAVTATITAKPEVHFGTLLGRSDQTITVDATAQIMGSGRVCAIALDSASSGAVSLENSARLTARKCAVFSNSTHRNGLKAHNTARVTSELTCSAGGVGGTAANFSPPPETDCPPIPDPLAARPAPPVGPCTRTNLVVEFVAILSPGVYCGGLKITRAAIATLRPGEYIIKDGPLIVDGTAKIVGLYVGFYFTGDNATFRFTKNTVVLIGAPKEGPLAGLLFFADRNNKPGMKYRIESSFAQKLLGTIYLPNGDLEIDAKGLIADRSAYTVVVSRTISLSSGPDLVLNSDYEASDVPVPAGVGPIGRNIVLTR